MKSEHENMAERIAAYLAGGLDEAQKREFETHLSDCGVCAAGLEESRRLDAWMAGIFGPVRPAEGFEDRIITAIRPRRRLFIHPAVWRVAGGIAAALVLGAVGYRADWIMGRSPDRQPASPQAQVAVADGEKLEKRMKDASKLPDFGNFFMERGTEYDTIANKDLFLGARFTKTLQSPDVAQKELKGINGRKLVEDSLAEQQVQREQAVSSAGSGQWQEQDRPVAVNGTVNITDLSDNLSLRAGVRVLDTAAGRGAGSTSWFDFDGDGKEDFRSFKPAEVALRYGREAKESAGVEAGRAVLAGEAVEFTVGQGLTDGRRPSGTTATYAFALAGDRNAPANGSERDRQGEGKQPDAPSTGVAAVAAPVVVNPVPPSPIEQQQNRKIIRNGELSFEVDSFDSSFIQITRIVIEEGGFVSSTNSEKLANGKVRGTVIVRMPPDRLDTLVLKLRALGDLKSQRITAQDVTKVYYDLEGELKAARAMEERLLNIIKSGKGEIKDLLEAEKQLGVYRERIEKLEGEVRYYNNLVSLSTLSITLSERDIRQAAFAAQVETVNMGIETEEVDKARDAALKAIDEAKGRVIESNLKNDDAGQFLATIVAEVKPDAAGPLIDRLRQLGRVARLNIDRKQTAAGDATVPAGVRIEQKDTRLSLTFYNLANVAPRRTSNMTIAAQNVEETYRSMLDLVGQKGGRIVASTLNRQKPEQTTADIRFEVPTADAEAFLAELRRDRDVLNLTVAENPDTNNVTSAKRGFIVSLRSLASVPARQSEQMVLVAKADVRESFNALIEQGAKLGVRIISSQLDDNDHANMMGTIEMEVMRESELELRTALNAAAHTVSRNVIRSTDAENTVDSKVRLRMQVMGQERLDPRQTTTLVVEASGVDALAGQLKQSAIGMGGRVVNAQQASDASGQTTSEMILDVPLAKADALQREIEQLGKVRVKQSTQNLQTPAGEFARARFTVTLASGDRIVADDQGLGTSIRNALSTSVRGLLWSLQFIVVGLLMVGPWAILLWAAWKLLRRKPAARMNTNEGQGTAA